MGFKSNFVEAEAVAGVATVDMRQINRDFQISVEPGTATGSAAVEFRAPGTTDWFPVVLDGSDMSIDVGVGGTWPISTPVSLDELRISAGSGVFTAIVGH